jgi:uncharacterized glyoxalase superfamily metalloenzyme YdcJ
MKAGTKIIITWIRPESDVAETATVARVTKAMGMMPAGYVPVRFADGSVLLVSSAAIREA